MKCNCSYSDDSTCTDIVCQNGGTCEEINGVPHCKCQLSYTGTYCENGEIIDQLEKLYGI